MNENDPLFGSHVPEYATRAGDGVSQVPIFQDRLHNKNTKMIIGAFLGLIAVFIGISIIMASVQSYKVTPLYILLLINLLAMSQVIVFMVYFVYTEKLTKNCFWFIFVFGACIIIESINTDILVFTIER